MTLSSLEPERLWTANELAAALRVDPKSVSRWVAAGRITSIRTPGGRHRFRESDVRVILNGGTPERQP